MNYEELNVQFIQSRQMVKIKEKIHDSIYQNRMMKEKVVDKRNDLKETFYQYVNEHHIAKKQFVIEIQQLDDIVFQLDCVLNQLYHFQDALNDKECVDFQIDK